MILVISSRAMNISCQFEHEVTPILEWLSTKKLPALPMSWQAGVTIGSPPHPDTCRSLFTCTSGKSLYLGGWWLPWLLPWDVSFGAFIGWLLWVASLGGFLCAGNPWWLLWVLLYLASLAGFLWRLSQLVSLGDFPDWPLWFVSLVGFFWMPFSRWLQRVPSSVFV